VLARIPAGHTAIVVDNGSTDGSSDVADAMGAFVVASPGAGSAPRSQASRPRRRGRRVHGRGRLVDPADLAAVVGPVELGAADLVLGARVADRGAWPVHARLRNRALAWGFAGAPA
jgi:glycosyltransferase involved in cell wall biosynthesis